jgi:5-dehydro-4-deoxyglucarate dehydratase
MLPGVISNGLNMNPQYPNSIVNVGAKIMGHDAGPVRPPLTDLKPNEVEELAVLIGKLGPR